MLYLIPDKSILQLVFCHEKRDTGKNVKPSAVQVALFVVVASPISTQTAGQGMFSFFFFALQAR